MKFAVLTVAAMLAAATAAPLSEEQYQFLFTRFSEQFGKKYEVSNVFDKYQTFKSNVDLIVAHNASGQGYTMAINKFADMSQQEFSQFMGLKVVETAPAANTTVATPCPGMKAQGFEKIDWNKAEKVGPVKDQGQCGSCWAFSALGALEPIMRIQDPKTFDLSLDLSEQFLVDCSGSFGNNGCSGGLMGSAYKYIQSKGGVPTTKDYPYTAKDESCKADKVKLVEGSLPKGYTTVQTNDEGHMEALKKGPVAVALAASSSAFQFYKEGVVSSCTDRSINHGVTLVATGEAADAKGDIKQFYMIRNSWGAGWGDAGHIRLEYGTKQCGLTTSSFDVQPFF